MAEHVKVSEIGKMQTAVDADGNLRDLRFEDAQMFAASMNFMTMRLVHVRRVDPVSNLPQWIPDDYEIFSGIMAFGRKVSAGKQPAFLVDREGNDPDPKIRAVVDALNDKQPAMIQRTEDDGDQESRPETEKKQAAE